MPKLYTLTTQPGVRRDGTTLDSPFYQDGVWVRWQRGRPRKMGGYKVVSLLANGPLRHILIDSRNGQLSAHYFSQWGVQRQVLGRDGAGAQLEDRTPSGFTMDPTLTWTTGLMYSSTGGTYSALVAASSPDLNDIANDVGGGVYAGNAQTNDVLVPIADGGGAISVSGGCCVLQPFLFLYGSNGFVYNSNANDYSTGTGWTTGGGHYANKANVAGTKVIYGAPTRGGTAAPSGLFWALDALIRVTFVGGTPIWNYDTISCPTTVLSKKAIVEHDGKFIWPGVDRFLMYAGTVQELPNDMSQNWFFDNLNFAARNKVWGTKIQRFGEIWWFYPRGNNTECSDAVIFNYRENTWYDAHLARSAGDKASSFQYPVWGGAEDGQQTLRIITSVQGITSAQTAVGLPAPALAVPSTSGSGGTLPPATTYYYTVTARNAAGETTSSNERSVTTSNGVVTPVLNTVTTSVSGGTGLTANTAYYYKITALNGAGETTGSNELSVTTAAALSAPSISSLTNSTAAGSLGAGVTYYYKVTALNAAGETTASAESSVTTSAGLSAPGSPAGTPSTTGGTFSTGDLYYKITAVNAVGETLPSSEVHAVTTGGLATPTANSATFVLNGFNGNFNPNTTYYFKVVAYNGTGTTVGSNEVSVTAPSLVAAPVASSAADATGSGGLPINTTYYYALSSFSSGSVAAPQSTVGNEVSATTSGAGGGHHINVNWAGVGGAAGGYNLFRGTSSGVYTKMRAISAGATTASDDDTGWSTAVVPTTNTTAEGDITVAWNSVSGATGYRVYQGTSAAGETGYYDAGNVTSYDNQGYSFNFTTGSVPSSNTSGGSASVALTWSSVGGATGYRVYRGTSAGAENVQFSAAGTSFTDTGASGSAVSPPGANTTSLNQNVVNWGAITGATGYRVYRGTVTNTENVYYAPGNVTSYTDTGAANTGGSPPGSNTTATQSSNGIAWSSTAGATSYRVYRGTATGVENVYYAPGNVTSYTDTGASSTGGAPPGSNTTASASCSNGLSWGAVTGATNYSVYRGLSAGGESVHYALGNVTSYTDTNAASTAGGPPAHNTTSNILTFASTPAGVANGMVVLGDPGIPTNTTVTSSTGTTVTLSDAVTSVVASGTLIIFSSITAGSNFNLGNLITGVTSQATGYVARVTSANMNIGSVTGAFLNGETISNGNGVNAVINSPPVAQQLDAVYQHEFGYDKVNGQQVNAILSSFTTQDFGFAVGAPLGDVPQTADVATRITRIEPDWDQVGGLSVTVNGRGYAQAKALPLKTYTFDSSVLRIDLREQARILNLTIASNTIGGFYEQGQVLLGLEPGDIRSDVVTP